MKLQWIPLESIEAVEQLIEKSHTQPQLIFKHSTRCSISSVAKRRLEEGWMFENESLPAYYLDLIRYRDVSGFIAEKLSVFHESPQIILVSKGECTYDESHLGIQVDELAEQFAQLAS